MVMDDIRIDIQENECTICLGEMIGTENYIIPECEHIYHKNCIKNWYNYNHNCPLCRIEFIDNELLNPIEYEQNNQQYQLNNNRRCRSYTIFFLTLLFILLIYMAILNLFSMIREETETEF